MIDSFAVLKVVYMSDIRPSFSLVEHIVSGEQNPDSRSPEISDISPWHTAARSKSAGAGDFEISNAAS
jgi:hypothetical protein